MHRNPLKRGLLLEPEQRQWSSYRTYAHHEQGRLEINDWPNARNNNSLGIACGKTVRHNRLTMAISWQNLIAIFGGEALLLAAVGWLVKALVTEWLKRSTESFKNKLETNAIVEIEQLKSSLQMAAAEHQIRFSHLQEKRASVIAELYTRLVTVFWQSRQFAFGPAFTQQPQQTEEYNKAAARLREFMEFVETHRIYLSVPVCDSLEKYVDKLNRTVIEIGVWGGGSDYGADTRTSADFKQTVERSFNAFQEDLPALRNALETEFRRILGVETPELHSNK